MSDDAEKKITLGGKITLNLSGKSISEAINKAKISMPKIIAMPSQKSTNTEKATISIPRKNQDDVFNNNSNKIANLNQQPKVEEKTEAVSLNKENTNNEKQEVKTPEKNEPQGNSAITEKQRLNSNMEKHATFMNRHRDMMNMNPVQEKIVKQTIEAKQQPINQTKDGAKSTSSNQEPRKYPPRTFGQNNFQIDSRPQIKDTKPKKSIQSVKAKKYDDESDAAAAKRRAAAKISQNDDEFDDVDESILQFEKGDQNANADFHITEQDLVTDEEKFFGKSLNFVTEKVTPKGLFMPKRSSKRNPGRYGEVYREVEISSKLSVKELADKISEKSGDVIKKLMQEGISATINSTLDQDTAQLIAESMGHKVIRIDASNELEKLEYKARSISGSAVRPPIVAIMGHVDHGKTSLLDYIRKKNVVAKESGGITQHIGAYSVKSSIGDIAFLDTPGHAAFAKMRSRGANFTDIAILIVSADDGVQDQTIEAIKYIKQANTPMIVAINKIDKDGSNIEKVKQDLLRYDVLPEELGGDVICVPVSAKTGQGVDDLLKTISLQAEMLEISSNLNEIAFGSIIESKFDKNLGQIATVILKHGQLSVGDVFVSGESYAKIKFILNDLGERIKTLKPGYPAEIFGFDNAPKAGEYAIQVKDEKEARLICDLFKQRADSQKKTISIKDRMLQSNEESNQQNVDVILKTDAFGSLEAISDMIESVIHPELRVKIISKGVGLILENDVLLAKEKSAMLLGFHTKVDNRAKIVMQREKIEANIYEVVYHLIDSVKVFAESKLGFTRNEKLVGKATIKQIFETKIDRVAGSYVDNGLVKIGFIAKITNRLNGNITETTVKNIKRFKDNVKEIGSGHECGILFADKLMFNDGDVINFYEEEFVAKML